MVNADSSIDESFSYYDISGNSIKELRESIYANSIVDTATRGFDASTNWSISSQFEYLEGGAGCKITATSIIAKIEYRLPRWAAFEDSKDAELKTNWRNYIENLTQHEIRHGEITRQAVSNIERTLLDLHIIRSDTPCDDLQTNAYATIDRLITALKQRHKKFDIDTAHGTKTGAVLP